MNLDSAKGFVKRTLPLALLLAQPAIEKSTTAPSNENPQKCELSSQELDERGMGMNGFRSDALRVLEEAPKPSLAILSNIQPTFDDGPHENDLSLIKALQTVPFRPAIFYYVGKNFYDENGDLDPAKAAIARAVLDAGYEIGFHGMTHAGKGDPDQMKTLEPDAFRGEIESFEKLIQDATGKTDYQVRHIRPPYGDWDGEWGSARLEEVAREQGAEVRNWAFASFDWEGQEKPGSTLFTEALRAAYSGKKPDILFHSQHQDGSTEGSFGQMLDAYSSQIASLLLPERQAEVASYRAILEGLSSDSGTLETSKLTPLQYSIGSSEQILVDASYNVGFEAVFQGSIQSQLTGAADGYIEGGTVRDVKGKYPEKTQSISDTQLRRLLRDPNQMLSQTAMPVANELPNLGTLNDKNVDFANRGLQVKKIAQDLMCRRDSISEFLKNYRLGELFVDPELIHVYEKMDQFLESHGLDAETRARILATAILESGVKNNWDKTGLGKGTWEAVAGKAHAAQFVPEAVIKGFRSLGQKKVADTLSFGPQSIGPGQVSTAVAHAMFEAILGRPIDGQTVKTLLDSPEGTAFTIYLILRQTELRLGSEKI